MIPPPPALGQPGAGFSRSAGTYTPRHLPAACVASYGPQEAFCARGQRGRGEAKTQNRRKGHLKARHGVLYPCGYPYIPTTSNGLQRVLHGQTGHKSTPAHSNRSKPGHCHLFRAVDSTAQRLLSASHQAQRRPRQDTQFSISTAPADAHPAIMIGQSLSAGLFAIAVSFIVASSKKSFHSCLTSRKSLK